LLDSNNLQLQRIDRLREILAETAPQEILDLLSKAKTLFNDAKLSLISGNLSSAETELIEAE